MHSISIKPFYYYLRDSLLLIVYSSHSCSVNSLLHSHSARFIDVCLCFLISNTQNIINNNLWVVADASFWVVASPDGSVECFSSFIV